MITQNLLSIQASLPKNVCLVAVSKTKPIDLIQEAYNAGQRVFGENKVQELVEKHELLPKDIEWHMIGHLQTNKVKYIAPFINLIHAVDSLKLLKEINKQAIRNNRVINCLIQIHVAREESKFGFNFEEIHELFSSNEFTELQNISIVGVMAMATNTSNTEQISDEFRTVENYFHILKSHFFKFNPAFNIISTGMSNDYKIAIEEGSTMVRIGSSIFGTR
jgi:pyridoxal phosphate enzyme (YggS family)